MGVAAGICAVLFSHIELWTLSNIVSTCAGNNLFGLVLRIANSDIKNGLRRSQCNAQLDTRKCHGMCVSLRNCHHTTVGVDLWRW